MAIQLDQNPTGLSAGIGALAAYAVLALHACGGAAGEMASPPAAISSSAYRVLEPYCSDPRVAYAALRVDTAFGDAVFWRDRKNALRQRESNLGGNTDPSRFEVAKREALASCEETTVEFQSARAQLLSELRTTGSDDPAARAMAHDVIVLAWRLSAVERHTLLVSAIEAHPAVEAAVVESLYRCVLEEFSLVGPGPQQELLRRLLPEGQPVLANRHQVQRRLGTLSAAVWTPDPLLRAADAAELVNAWLASQSRFGRDRKARCYHLIGLSYSCITPEMTPGSAPIHRLRGEPLLVATHALFPEVQAVVDELKDEALATALTAARDSYGTRRLVGQILDWLARLQAIVDQQGREIASLRSALVAVNSRVDALEKRIAHVETEVDHLKRRVGAIERFLSNELADAEANALLKQVAPILLHHEWESGPLMRPSDFAKDATFLVKDGTDDRIRNDLASRRNRGFEPEELARWLQEEAGTPQVRWRDLTANLELIPQEVRRRGLGAPNRGLDGARVKQLNKDAIESRAAVFGAVSPLPEEGAQLWSVKYFWFHAWNETAFPYGEGNHEGDWGCVDLTVHLPFAREKSFDIAGASVKDAIIHEHGRPHRFPRDQLEFDPARGRLRIYLERGTNEAHPGAGGASEYKGLGIGSWGLRYPVIREHRGSGYEYDLSTAVLNLFDDDLQRKNIEVQLVVYYRGEWGEYDDDDFKSVPFIGKDITNPPGPLENEKFRDRAGVIDHRGRP